MQDECRRWNAQTEASWVKEASKLLKSTRSPSQASATNETSGMSETNASETSETCSKNSVETPTLDSLHTDLSSYNNDGRHVVLLRDTSALQCRRMTWLCELLVRHGSPQRFVSHPCCTAQGPGSLFHFSLCRCSLHLDTEQCARSPERRATARTLRVWNRLLRRPIFIFIVRI